jgi:hypothetical protein
MLNRILKSYWKEVEDLKKQKDYIPTGLWTNADNIKYDNLKERLPNFGSDKISEGLSLCNVKPNEENIRYDAEIWGKLTGLSCETLKYPKSFGFNGVELNGVFTIPVSFRMSYSAKRINDLSDGNVVEIGTGFGGVPYHLFKDFNFKRTYFNFDIPHPNLISKYFLMSVFPKKKFLLYGEDKLKNFKKYDLVFMPHFMIKELPKNCCDIVFNAHSLTEMGNTQIKEYLKHIDRISTKWFLHFNHRFQATPRKGFTLKDVDVSNPIDFDNLKIKNWKRIYKFIELLSDDKGLDYFEYLYQKI